MVAAFSKLNLNGMLDAAVVLKAARRHANRRLRQQLHLHAGDVRQVDAVRTVHVPAGVVVRVATVIHNG